MQKIILRKSKCFDKTNDIRVFKGEKNADYLDILIPITYNNIDLSTCNVRMTYITPDGNEHSFLIDEYKQDNIYKDVYYEYLVNITERFTSVKGDIEIYLSITKSDNNNDNDIVLKSETTIISIDELPLGADGYTEEQLEIIDQVVLTSNRAIQIAQSVRTDADNGVFTPVKGVDYFTQEDIDEIAQEAKPVKGVDYFTEEEKNEMIQEATPVKGVDYFTSQEISQITHDATPIKGVDYFTSEDIDEVAQEAADKVPPYDDTELKQNKADKSNTGCKLALNINTSNYLMTVSLLNNNNVVLDSKQVDFPIESMVVSASYDSDTKELVLTLQNGTTTRISIADLISGLVSEDELTLALANFSETKSRIYEAVLYNNSISYNVADYPGIQMGDIAYFIQDDLTRLWFQITSPDDNTVYWTEMKYNSNKVYEDTNVPPNVINISDISNTRYKYARIGDTCVSTISNKKYLYYLVDRVHMYGALYRLDWVELTDYYSKEEINTLLLDLGNNITASVNSDTYVCTFNLKHNNTIIATTTIDLPLESVVMGGYYDSENKKVVLTLKNGGLVEFSIADLVDGLLNESTFYNTMENLGDIEFYVTKTEQQIITHTLSTWNIQYEDAKYSKGISLEDVERNNGLLEISGDFASIISQIPDFSGSINVGYGVGTNEETIVNFSGPLEISLTTTKATINAGDVISEVEFYNNNHFFFSFRYVYVDNNDEEHIVDLFSNTNSTLSYMSLITSVETKTINENFYDKNDINTLLNNKQNNIIAGNNINIASDGKTISATDTTYSAGAGINITNNVISADGQLKLVIVNSLPTQNIDLNTIYLVPKQSSGTNDVYNEYIYVNNSWELIGTTQIDLSNYLAKDNTTSYTPTGNYHPATKKYVDDEIEENSMYPSFNDTTHSMTYSNTQTSNIITDNESTIVSVSLIYNQENRYTQELSLLTIILPQIFEDDFISSVVFASGSTATAMTYDSGIKWSGDDVTSNAFVPQANKVYNIVLWYDGINVNAVVRGV